MSVFTRKDPRLLASADPSWDAALFAMLRRHLGAAGAIVALVCLVYAANVWVGFHAAAQEAGSIGGLGVYRNASIARDARGIPYIRAHNMHDLFFAEGFAQASDRLFEMDVTRRYAYGTLSAVFGAKALALDEEMRAADIRGIAQREWRNTDPATRLALEAFSAGVNAAEAREPLPVEFRMLLYRPGPWTPQDSIAVSVVAAFELGDSWNDVFRRDERWKTLGRRCYKREFPLSDPRYDVTLGGRRLRGEDAASLPARCLDSEISFLPGRPRMGSNAWAAGSKLTLHHRALIANDPHVELTIPGIWYVVELRAPHFHAAGAVIPGLPGVALGHNGRLAWAVTDAEVATTVLYRGPAPPDAERVVERFRVRFARPVSKIYYRTRDAFSVPDEEGSGRPAFVRWPSYWQKTSTISTLLALDRAADIPDAMRALAAYQGAPQNFILADAGGAVAYHLAGSIPDDPAWGRYAHPTADLSKPLRVIPFARLPARAPSREAVLLSANNKMYGPGYPYRLSAAFEPPYRAYRIAQLLRARKRYGVRYFERMQLDTCSPIDRRVARDLLRITRPDRSVRGDALRTALARWNGCFEPSSRSASLEHGVLAGLLQQSASLPAVLDELRSRSARERYGLEEDVAAALQQPEDAVSPWGRAGAVGVDHPLSAAWYGLLRGASLPGDGDEYTIHLQEPGFAQGFRAVWEAGRWNAGGIVIPSGESGEPGSGHYDDLAKTWIAGAMVALPFGKHAIARAAVETLRLHPRAARS